jgi:hypothetical protein
LRPHLEIRLCLGNSPFYLTTFGTRRRHGDPPLLIIVLCFDSGIFIAAICIDADQKLALFSTIN